MERLHFDSSVPYDAVETAIHLNRYAVVKTMCSKKRVLDIACGEGYGSNLMRQWGAASVDGLDINVGAIENAKKNFSTENVSFQVANAENLPFPDQFFDIAVSFETIEHLDNPVLFLQELKRVVKDSGVIVISCPNDPYYFGNGEVGNPYHKRKYTFWDFKEMVEGYLGSGQYQLAFAVDGFMNIPIDKSTYPEDEKKHSMMELMEFEKLDNAFTVNPDRFLNHWNCNYYIGIWGNTQALGMSSVIFGRETFREIPNDYDRIYKCWQGNLDYYHKLETAHQKLLERADIAEVSFAEGYLMLEELITENKNGRCIEIQRLETMLELSNREKACLYENLELSNREKESLYENQTRAEKYIYQLENSTSWKVTKPLRHLVDCFKHFFRR